MTNSNEITQANSLLNLDEQSVVKQIVSSDDVSFVNDIAHVGAATWGMMQSITMIACYRMKLLFESVKSRKQAVDVTGYTSWCDWLDDLGLPISVSLVRTRAIDVDNYLKAGADWPTIGRILANAPTAGSDVFKKVAGSDGNLLSHIDPEDLPGGSVKGLLEAIAALPSPGQARKLVSEVSKESQVYPTKSVLVNGVLYVNITYETANGDEYLFTSIRAKDDRGTAIAIPEEVAHWISDKLQCRLEVVV